MDRNSNIVTEEEDRKKEEQHIKNALQKCGYPEWSVERVKRQIERKKGQEKARKVKKKEDTNKSKGLVVLPYVKGVSELMDRIFRKHNIATAMKPHRTIRSVLVHPKDKIKLENKSEIVYSIPCKHCDKVYIGETSRNFKYRLEEHKKDVD